MKYFDMAIRKELNREYINAVDFYEEEIKLNPTASPNTFINLAFLYWLFASEQISFNEPNNISDEWSLIGGKRFSKIIECGLKIYPRNIELNFWNKYFSYRLFGSNFSKKECESLLDKKPKQKTIIPYFFLYLFDKKKYLKRRDEILKQCEELPIIKNLYIKSLII